MGISAVPSSYVVYNAWQPVTYAHIIPKSEQSILTKKQDVVNHPGNLVPTIDTIHEQMELYRTLPGFTLICQRAHPDQTGKDIYAVRVAPHIIGEHILLRFIRTRRKSSCRMPLGSFGTSTCMFSNCAIKPNARSAIRNICNPC